jgi:c-di-GMP-binding flagellar brake protein YcgR
MSLQELSFKQINEALNLASQKNVPITITIRQESAWLNFPSRMVAITGKGLLVELPPVAADVPPHEFVPAEKMGVSFKLKHHKHLFTATAVGLQDFPLEGGESIKVLALCLPVRMQRLQRRMFYRVDIPSNRVVRASFWLGGKEAEPNGTSDATPVWSGRVTNLSAGGFQVLSTAPLGPMLEVGDSVGVRLSFGSGQESIYADAQLRQVVLEGVEQWTVGLQFVALAQSPEGREALMFIGRKVSEFQQIAERSAVTTAETTFGT